MIRYELDKLKNALEEMGYFDFKDRRRNNELDLIARTPSGSIREFLLEDSLDVYRDYAEMKNRERR